jgi:hypothetical protein
MPWIKLWRSNSLFLEHKGVRIFHVYQFNSAGKMLFHFGTASDATYNDDPATFYVMTLPTWKAPDEASTAKDYDQANADASRSAIIAAIDGGLLRDYIEAAEGRPKRVPINDLSEQLERDLWHYSTEEIQALLEATRQTVLRKIDNYYRSMCTVDNPVVPLKKVVEYSDGFDYTINALTMDKDDKQSTLQFLQGEEEEPEGDDDQYVYHLRLEVLVKLLSAIVYTKAIRDANELKEDTGAF